MFVRQKAKIKNAGDRLYYFSGTDTCLMQWSSLSRYISWGSGRDWAIYCMQQVPVMSKWSWLWWCHHSWFVMLLLNTLFFVTFEHVMWILYLPIHFWMYKFTEWHFHNSCQLYLSLNKCFHLIDLSPRYFEQNKGKISFRNIPIRG